MVSIRRSTPTGFSDVVADLPFDVVADLPFDVVADLLICNLKKENEKVSIRRSTPTIF